MHRNTLVRFCLGTMALLPNLASALVVEIQGVRLEPPVPGASCVEITGDYRGVRIEAEKPGQPARICYSAGRGVNSLSIVNATLIAAAPVKQDVRIRFEHEFPAGINGKVVARAKARGFFATGNGVGVPAGDTLTIKASFSQNGSDDVIGEPLNFAVGIDIDSALVDYSVKEPYLIAGSRSLKGLLISRFNAPSHKLSLPDRCVIVLDSGATLDDRPPLPALPDEAPAEPQGTEPTPPDASASPAPEDIPSFPGVTSGSSTPGK